jgi:hypothetical protein
MKGDGETHPFLSPNDEFANFERWDKGNLDLSEKKKPEMLEFEYVRSAYKNGLKLEKEFGVNPYKFGLVGSTDAHTGLTAADEDNYFGKISTSEPNATRAHHPMSNAKPDSGDHGLGTSAWLRRRVGEREHAQSTDAMKRKETYATPPGRAWSCASSQLRFRGCGREQPDARKDWHPWCADGRRPRRHRLAKRRPSSLPP